MATWPCTNPNCSSHGRPHPNCRCPAPMAHGGEINFCASHQKHLPGCEYYADGGNVEHPAHTLGHHVVTKGLLGLLSDTGKSSLQEPEKHDKILSAAQEAHANMTSNPETLRPRTSGGRLGHHMAEGDHDKAAAAVNGTPLAGLVGKNHLPKALSKMTPGMTTQPPNSQAFRGGVDYLTAASKGENLMDKHIDNVITGKGSLPIHMDPGTIDKLKQKIDELAGNPSLLLDSPGDLGHYLPEDSTQVAATSAAAVNYLNSIKPLNQQKSPLDAVLPPSKSAVSDYDRQVGNAQNPAMLLQHAKNGTLIPTDIVTVQTVYPKLYQSLTNKIGEQIIDITSKGHKVPYKMRSSLSMLLGRPLDSTMSSDSMQAIIKSASPKSNSPQSKQGKTGETAVSQKAINKADSMTATTLQARQIDKKS